MKSLTIWRAIFKPVQPFDPMSTDDGPIGAMLSYRRILALPPNDAVTWAIAHLACGFETVLAHLLIDRPDCRELLRAASPDTSPPITIDGNEVVMALTLAHAQDVLRLIEAKGAAEAAVREMDLGGPT